MAIKFEVGQMYGDRITVLKRTEKTILAYREHYDKDKGESIFSTDKEGEHRYKIFTDGNGDEYTIIDRMNSYRYEVWGNMIFADRRKRPSMVCISG